MRLRPFGLHPNCSAMRLATSHIRRTLNDMPCGLTNSRGKREGRKEKRNIWKDRKGINGKGKKGARIWFVRPWSRRLTSGYEATAIRPSPKLLGYAPRNFTYPQNVMRHALRAH